jgi:hypothetical protein
MIQPALSPGTSTRWRRGATWSLSHVTDEYAPEGFRKGRAQAREDGMVVAPRGKDSIFSMFNGRELLDPGLVLVSRWRPGNGRPDPNADTVMAYGGVAAL